MTAEQLRARTRNELATKAKRRGLRGWHAMRKEELVQALLKADRRDRPKERRRGRGRNGKGVASNGASAGRNGHAGSSTHRGASVPDPGPTIAARDRDLSSPSLAGRRRRGDPLRAEVQNPFWIRLEWSLHPSTVARAQTALGSEWHRARPVIRVFEVAADDEPRSRAKRWVRDIGIHGRVDHWYVPVDDPPCTWVLHVGYLTPGGRFYALSRTGNLRIPAPGSRGTAEPERKAGTAPNDLPAARAHRNGRASPRNGAASNGHAGDDDFPFSVDAELIVHGEAHPGSELTVLGEPVRLTKDGRFTLRFSLPEGRRVIPTVTVTPSGHERRTIILAVERNTKELEPQPTDELTP